MTVVLILFLGAASLLWLSVFGYLLGLRIVAMMHRATDRHGAGSPEIAVVVPTLNEEALILSKLDDLQRTEYPCGRMTVVVVDGGSVDHTTALVQEAIDRGAPIELLRVAALTKSDQINYALRMLTQEIVVVTDADAVLEPSCIRELVGALVNDPQAAVVGATVRPATALLEERIHWWFLNYLWWLEGEVLSAAAVSGVCYAVRRHAVAPLAPEVRAEDVCLALAAGTHGWRVRTSQAARATELRVPQTARELIGFRRRRGTSYRRELLRVQPAAGTRVGWRLAHRMRLWHFLVTPKMGAALAVIALVLLCTPHWPWPLLALGAFAVPTLAALYSSTTLSGTCPRGWRLGLAAGHLLTLTWWSMMAMGPVPSKGSR